MMHTCNTQYTFAVGLAVFKTNEKEPPHRNFYAMRIFPYLDLTYNENPYFPLYTCFTTYFTEGHSNFALFNSLSSSV